MTDPFLEYRVRDMVAMAKQQLALGAHDAARDAYRNALDAIHGALSLDPSNETAIRLQKELKEDMAQPSTSNMDARTAQVPAGRPVPPPAFELIKEGDAPLFETGGELFGPDRGGYLPEPEVFSILDTKPHAAKPDYLRAVAAVLAVIFLAVAVRVVWYYSTSHVVPDTTPPEMRAQYAAPPPVVAPAPSAGPEDTTLYYPEPGVTLPLLRSKFEPKASAPGSVVLLVVIDPTGKPVEARVYRGLDADLNVRAIEAAGKWRFRPGTKDGKPVPVLAQLEVTFRQQ